MGEVIRPVPLEQNVPIPMAGDMDWAVCGRLQETVGVTQ